VAVCDGGFQAFYNVLLLMYQFFIATEGPCVVCDVHFLWWKPHYNGLWWRVNGCCHFISLDICGCYCLLEFWKLMHFRTAVWSGCSSQL